MNRATPARRRGRFRSMEPLVLLLAVAAVVGGCELRRGRALLAAGEPARLLRTVRPRGAEAYRLRARALIALGRLRDAEVELRIALALEETSAEGHRLIGFVEGRIGHQGGALEHLTRSLALDPEQPQVARAVARLLVRRALLRLDRGIGLGQREAARRELERAIGLDPALAAEARGLLERAKVSGGDESVRTRAPRECPGVPLDQLQRGRPLVPIVRRVESDPGGAAGCSRRTSARCGACAGRLLRRLHRRHLLVGCEGVRLALWLERRGCLSEALQVWRALRAETPDDPRWIREIARMLLAFGHRRRAEQMLTAYVHAMADRAGGQLQAARLLLAAGVRRWGAHRAVRALALARDLEQQLAVVRLLQESGLIDKAREAADYLLRRRRQLSVEEAQLRSRLCEITGCPPRQTPRR